MGPTTDLGTAKTIARAAVSGNVTFADQAKATDILKEFYTQAGKVGAEAAGEQINADPIANLPSVKELLDKAHLTIKNITDTQMDQISTAVRDGLMNGDPASVIAGRINAGLLDEPRAQLIAVTEGNRAFVFFAIVFFATVFAATFRIVGFFFNGAIGSEASFGLPMSKAQIFLNIICLPFDLFCRLFYLI